MAALTYKCPNCGGSMVFDPEKQQFACEYCLSVFRQEELAALTPDISSEEVSEASSAQTKEDTLLYSCPSCGAQLAMNQTTAADFCYYCHNPIVLSGKLEGAQMPSLVVPFQFSKDAAKERFGSWIGRKRYIPSAFYSKKQIEKLSGVYFPYWTCDCTIQGSLSGSARDLRVWRSGEIEYTETKVFTIRRTGQVCLHDLSRNALQKAQVKMLEGILPFDLRKAEPFHTSFLSGFQAEIKDMEKDAFEADIHQESERYVKSLLTDTIVGHGSFSAESFHISREHDVWRYVLLPVWILTYRDKDELYYFAMNGQTGEICGRLPLDCRKLLLTCTGIFFAVAGLITLLGGLLL